VKDQEREGQLSEGLPPQPRLPLSILKQGDSNMSLKLHVGHMGKFSPFLQQCLCEDTNNHPVQTETVFFPNGCSGTVEKINP
jgi:hypothetical protein